jgi:cysteine synthase
MKLLSALLIAGFLYYMVRRKLQQRRLERAGVVVEPSSGMRPITILALLMLGMYGGYMLFHLLSPSSG